MKNVLIVLVFLTQFSCQFKKADGESNSRSKLLTGRSMGRAFITMDGEWKIIEVSCDEDLTDGQKKVVRQLNEKFADKTFQVYDGYFRFDDIRVKYGYYANALFLTFQESKEISQSFGIIDFDDQTLTFLGSNPFPRGKRLDVPKDVSNEIEDLTKDVVGSDTFTPNNGLDIPESISDPEWVKYSYAGPFALRDIIIKLEKIGGKKLEGEVVVE